MAITNEIWVADIAENLFPDNSFMARSIDDSAFADAYGVVNLPQSGAKPNVVRNRTTIPAASSERVDTIVNYNLDSYTTDPTRIRNMDELETSYDKRQNVLMDHTSSLEEQISNWMAYHWCNVASPTIVRTTGADRAATAPSATGTRKAITKDDFLEAKLKMDAADIPMTGRYVLLPATMYNDLLKDGDILSSEKMGTANLASGAVGRLLGFDIYIRSSTVIYDNTPTLKLPGAAGAATDNLGAIFWQEKFVRRAKGAVKVFADEDQPLVYGDVFSAEALAGGRPRYEDGRGVVILVEGV